MIEIQNAKITSTMLGFEDHGIFTSMIYLEMNGSGIGFGGYVIDGEACARLVKAILKTVGVDTWEELEGKHVRVKIEDNRAVSIGNIMKEEWLTLRELFPERK